MGRAQRTRDALAGSRPRAARRVVLAARRRRGVLAARRRRAARGDARVTGDAGVGRPPRRLARRLRARLPRARQSPRQRSALPGRHRPLLATSGRADLPAPRSRVRRRRGALVARDGSARRRGVGRDAARPRPCDRRSSRRRYGRTVRPGAAGAPGTGHAPAHARRPRHQRHPLSPDRGGRTARRHGARSRAADQGLVRRTR